MNYKAVYVCGWTTWPRKVYLKYASTAADLYWTTCVPKVKILLRVFAEETCCSAHHCTETELRVFKVTCSGMEQWIWSRHYREVDNLRIDLRAWFNYS